jgi:hypothetical protein
MRAKRIVPWVVGGLLALAAPFAGADDTMKGWEKASPYNRHYNADELDRIRVEIVDITEMVPMPGMAPGVGIVVREAGDEPFLVHLCPVAYLKPSDIGLTRGDRVKIRGAWAEIEGEDVFMAAKIKKGDHFSLKVRLTRDGTPFWTMSPEQLKKEKNEE